MGSHVCTMAVPSLLLWVWIALLQTCLSSPAAGTGLPDSCSSNICSCDTNDDGWFKAYPCNCHWYYQCNKVGNGWNPAMFDCGEWVFDPHQEACIWPELAPPEMCDLPNNCTMATTTPPPTTTPMTCPCHARLCRMAPATQSAAKTRTAPAVSVTLVALVSWETVGGDLTVRDTILCVTSRGSKGPTTVSFVTTWTPTKKLDHVNQVVRALTITCVLQLMTCALEFMAVPILEQLFSRKSISLLDHVLGVVLTTLRVGLRSLLLPQEQSVPLRILTIQVPKTTQLNTLLSLNLGLM